MDDVQSTLKNDIILLFGETVSKKEILRRLLYNEPEVVTPKSEKGLSSLDDWLGGLNASKG